MASKVKEIKQELARLDEILKASNLPIMPSSLAGSPKQLKRPRAPGRDVRVTSQIIAGAEQKNSAHCMVAESIQNEFPTAKHIAVDIQTIRFSDPKKRLRYIYLTPRSVQHAIINFDEGEHTDEFVFRLAKGHVIPMATLSEKRSKSIALYQEKNKDKRRENARKSSEANVARRQRRQFLVMRDNKGGMGTQPPERFGGAPPPVAPGQRREFGLRAFQGSKSSKNAK